MVYELGVLVIVVLITGSDAPSLLQNLTNALETLATFSVVTLVSVTIHIHLPSRLPFFSNKSGEDDDEDEGPKGGMEVIDWGRLLRLV
ncbi:hypothetical protein [Halorussus halophilus]|uniref:hypothetical protein n=1 Tax=Halorussus halophilus TaxID=2650975 RepID=UPI00130108ED|nr:hypothetical protein [Halorussus halophilus]